MSLYPLFLLQDLEKRTPMHAAAYLGNAEIMELLILSGDAAITLPLSSFVSLHPLSLLNPTSLALSILPPFAPCILSLSLPLPRSYFDTPSFVPSLHPSLISQSVHLS